MPRGLPLVLACAFGTATLMAADVKFSSKWKHIDAASVSFAGKKVAALVITQDDSLRVAGEEALVRELTPRGLQMVATYRIVPKPELEKAEKARVWYEQAGVEGVIAVRPVSADKVRTYTPGTWTDPYYSSFWSYYGYGWGSYYIPGTEREDFVVVVETLIFSVPRNMLLWAAVSETKNPNDLQQFVKDLVIAAAKEMQKDGLARGGTADR
ncbi:MAG TPA: hypothetical protein VLD67_20245 [Vicinamibacterales bacterium]|nr:hypothetical protein [Vicinamibacterales bacterium]